MNIERKLLDEAIDHAKELEKALERSHAEHGKLRMLNSEMRDALDSIERKAKTSLSDTPRDIREREVGTGRPIRHTEHTGAGENPDQCNRPPCPTCGR